MSVCLKFSNHFNFYLAHIHLFPPIFIYVNLLTNIIFLWRIFERQRKLQTGAMQESGSVSGSCRMTRAMQDSGPVSGSCRMTGAMQESGSVSGSCRMTGAMQERGSVSGS